MAAIEIARDWLDYAEAIGAVVSLLLAAIAAAFAWRSASDSSRSATAAEQTATAAAEEASLSRQMVKHLEEQLEIERTTRSELERERQRRPILSAPTLNWLGRLDPGQLTVGLLREMGIQPGMGGRISGIKPVVVRARFQNIGDKVAEQVLVRCLVPAGVVPLESGPRGDTRGRPDLRVAESTSLRSPAGEAEAREFSWRIGHLPPHQSEDAHLTLVLRSAGEYEVLLELEHPEADTVQNTFLVSADSVQPDQEADKSG
ncbi:MAG: hypothetical protein ACTHK3_12555 [Solirubrobacterales bacterium]